MFTQYFSIKGRKRKKKKTEKRNWERTYVIFLEKIHILGAFLGLTLLLLPIKLIISSLKKILPVYLGPVVNMSSLSVVQLPSSSSKPILCYVNKMPFHSIIFTKMHGFQNHAPHFTNYDCFTSWK